ncbi:MAG TPA: CDP-diacylglycerol--serine O-phosphatidyltransferase [Herpetosiphon sp.]|nr:CDP-diacylglycerol--serine O-phosphatidyltransferase [Herpetosiphon sp.]
MAVKFRRSWVPNLVTSGNLFCGFLAVIAAVDGQAFKAAVLICLAASFDTLDGRAARMLGVSGEFGKELDSLADVVSFGTAPALLIYQISLREVGWIGTIAAGIFVCCGAGRLARYNLITSSDKRFFVGMPIPMAGMTAASLALYTGALNPYVATALIGFTGFLMISTLRFPSVEQIAFETFLPIRIAFIVIFVLALARPSQFLYVLPLSYISYGMIANIVWAIRGRGSRSAA